MKKSFVFASVVVLALFAGCGKKEETAAKTESKTVDKAPTAPTAPSPTPAAPAAPAEPDKLMDVAEATPDSPKECVDARAAYVKIHGCAKLDEKMRASLVKSWNDVVEGSLKRWKDASDDQKKTITDSCKKMAETAGMLASDC